VSPLRRYKPVLCEECEQPLSHHQPSKECPTIYDIIKQFCGKEYADQVVEKGLLRVSC